tara:strand:+ start:3236 stop:3346 length:111 start_codon:yes stop_codon:yes gene_type:complete
MRLFGFLDGVLDESFRRAQWILLAICGVLWLLTKIF